MFKNQFAFID